jgi:hypothetical protein
MNDIKEKEQLPIVPLATIFLSRESGQTDKAATICSPMRIPNKTAQGAREGTVRLISLK